MVMGMELENRMISAEWLKSKCYEICDEYNTERLHIDRIIDEIDNAPDVEVVHGRWLTLEEYAEKIGADSTGYMGGWVFCSECDQQMRTINGWLYCPNCGAKMDGVQK